VHTLVAKPTLCTAADSLLPSSQPPRRSTCPWSLSLSSIATAAEPALGLHDNGGRNFSFHPSSPATESQPKVSTLAVRS
jgi:hypothetical protein